MLYIGMPVLLSDKQIAQQTCKTTIKKINLQKKNRINIKKTNAWTKSAVKDRPDSNELCKKNIKKNNSNNIVNSSPFAVAVVVVGLNGEHFFVVHFVLAVIFLQVQSQKELRHKKEKSWRWLPALPIQIQQYKQICCFHCCVLLLIISIWSNHIAALESTAAAATTTIISRAAHASSTTTATTTTTVKWR